MKRNVKPTTNPADPDLTEHSSAGGDEQDGVYPSESEEKEERGSDGQSRSRSSSPIRSSHRRSSAAGQSKPPRERSLARPARPQGRGGALHAERRGRPGTRPLVPGHGGLVERQRGGPLGRLGADEDEPRGGRTARDGGRPPPDPDRRAYGVQRATREREQGVKRQRDAGDAGIGELLEGPIVLDDDVDPEDRNPAGIAPATAKSMSKQWCYTLNNPTKQTVPRLRGIDIASIPSCEYHIFQLEVSKSGTLHCQGFICFATRVRLSTVKTLLGGNPHLEVARGTPEQAADYCRRREKRHPRHVDFLHEYGTMPAARNAGGRSDLTALQALLDGGATAFEVAKADFPSWIRFNKAIDKYRTEFVQKPRTHKSLIFVFVGETGTGKSNAAYAFLNAFPVPPGSSGTTWFDGYDPDSHQTVIMEEFHGGRCSWTELLRLTDQYPMTVNSKGSHLQFSPQAIVFTSNDEPTEWYTHASIPDKEPFLRRIDVMWHYYKTDSNKLSPDVLQLFGEHAFSTKAHYHSIAVCMKGDPDFHPHAKRHEKFWQDVNGNIYFAVLQQATPDPIEQKALWE